MTKARRLAAAQSKGQPHSKGSWDRRERHVGLVGHRWVGHRWRCLVLVVWHPGGRCACQGRCNTGLSLRLLEDMSFEVWLNVFLIIVVDLMDLTNSFIPKLPR